MGQCPAKIIASFVFVYFHEKARIRLVKNFSLRSPDLSQNFHIHKTFTFTKLSLSQNLHLHKTFTRYGLSRASLYAPPTFNKNFHFHKTFTRYGLSRASLYAPPDLVRFPDLLLSGNQTTPDLPHIENVGQTKVSDHCIGLTILL